ncbi:hypothetical protein [Gallibacterium genomosp. 3]|uniref:Lipoprotein n=1 Tax=Gallibacterium genomosp. 3 TaxID=505345 RepID=A0A1A7PTI5_9PAST|nr:hypothetical protein [Gallibacterium genomosp. 3]OBX04475.1 hypothetical protein QV07_10185 [Gallibacterium genomosp. 3]
MQKLKNFFLISLFTLFLVACGDKTAALKTDVSNLRQTLDTALKQENGTTLIQQLKSAQTNEEKVKVYNNIISSYQVVIKAINDLKINTDEAKSVQAKYNEGLTLFVDLMKTSSNFTTHQPSLEEVKAYTELQNKTTKTLGDAERALADLQKQIDDTAKKVESKN